ncbi:hypothetical protein K450DRAFT_229240 [Umbelopsis ramanniana AG]|uniref:Major facilitator superfamily (MFS) profile domain-containing protein n=1 Tax=Umbelopsis ramanniana AG TaxID=1314678 RepID=A0AAD5EF19_UMBRA|nr:uncharacterized protein K450DRAFT_229240 [Umbelopsis ramanniana AG]KAI8582147.1 hypothetical protein K450DRAFT_229240 [Umbelopsis ramanniana AG]
MKIPIVVCTYNKLVSPQKKNLHIKNPTTHFFLTWHKALMVTAHKKSGDIDYSVVDPNNKWKILRHHWRYALWALWTAMGSMMQGFDYTVGGQLLAMPAFKQQFGTLVDGDYIIRASIISAWSVLGLGLDLITAIIITPIIDRWGRKPFIAVAALISTGAVIIQQLSTEWRLQLVGRGLNGVAIGIMFTISPLWIGETCRPELRGFFLCCFNSSIVLGQFLMVVISEGSSHINGKWSYLTPFVTEYFFPALYLAFFIWFPESPYWLVKMGDNEKALRSLHRMYGIDDDEFYQFELKRLQADVVSSDETQGSSSKNATSIWSQTAMLECFKGKNLKRTMTSIVVTSTQQLVGASFVTGYVTYFLQLIGISQSFLVSVVLFVFMLMSTLASFPLVEIVGRRTMIVPAVFVLALINLLIGIMGCISNTVAAGWAILVLIFLWAIIYQCSIGAVGFVLASEIATLHLRAATQGLVTVSNCVWGLVFQFTVPYMINPDAGNLGGKTGFIFFGCALLASIACYFLVPETKGMSFEMLDDLYANNVKPWNFKKVAAEKSALRNDTESQSRGSLCRDTGLGKVEVQEIEMKSPSVDEKPSN